MKRLSLEQKPYLLRALLYGILTAAVLFLPFIIYDKGYFLFYGDFNVQQVPFYQMCHDAIRSGNVKWSWTTDLGANFVGSYSFYLLGSPFFWLTIPFPSQAVPYLMGPLYILKFGCATMNGSIYIRRYVHSSEGAILGGMLYAFSGFAIYNVFFNHFHEAIVFFPLLLWSLDEYMYRRRRGVFAFFVFVTAFINYYFFVGMVTFLLIYWLLRFFQKDWRISARDFGFLAMEAVLGVLCACAILLPTILCIVQNPRVNSPSQGWYALLYDNEQRYLHILSCFFFPPDLPARANFTPDSNSQWASLGAWLPLFSMTGVIAFLQRKKKNWLKTMLFILFFMTMVPILNSAFQLFNSSYYARWFYMITLMMSLATVRSLELSDVDWLRAIKWTIGITLGISLPIGFMVKKVTSGEETTWSYGLEKYPSRFWPYVAIALLSLLLLLLIFHEYQKNRRRFMKMAIFGTACISVVYGWFFITTGKTQGDDTHNELIPYALNGGKDIDLPYSDTFSRIDVYDGMDNLPMYWQMPTIQAFHSIVPGSVMDFYPTIGVKRDVASRPDTKVYALRSFTSCRWLFDPTTRGQNFVDPATNQTRMPGWTYITNENGSNIYENEYFIPMGFSYQKFITRAEYNELSESQRCLVLLKAVVLPNDTAAAIAEESGLTHLDSPQLADFSQQSYFKDCVERAAGACTSFTTDNNGFSAVAESSADRLIFFSVPYESGWSATVNGQPAEIEKVNVGFMAVKVPAGEAQIRFNYETPGLKIGIFLSIAGFLILGVYVFRSRQRKRWIEQQRKLDKGV